MADDLPREVMEHGYQIRSLQEAALRADATVMDLRKDVEKLEDSHSNMEKSFTRWVAAAEATEKHAQRIANQAITTRQFYVGLGILIVAFIGLALGIKA